METKKMSKTKIGAVLIGASMILGSIGGWMTGAIDPISAIQAVMFEVGGIFAVFGIRGWPILNRTK